MSKRIGTYNEYFGCWEMKRKDILRLIARGWQPCEHTKEVVDQSLRILTPNGTVSTLKEHPDASVGIMFDKENAMLVLYC